MEWYASAAPRALYSCDIVKTFTAAPPPICVRLVCMALQPTRGMIMEGNCAPGGVDDVCKISCMPGYRLEGPSERKCLETGEWDGQEALCVPIICPAFTLPANSVMDSCTNVALTACAVKCTPGFRFSDGSRSLNITCDSNGKWTPSTLPSCNRITCPPLAAPPNGAASLTCSTAVAGETCKQANDPIDTVCHSIHVQCV